jgi:hypothetical protein
MEIVTYHADGLHIAIRHGKQPLSGESHLGLSLSKLGLLVAFALEFAPEGRRWQVAIRGSNGHEVGGDTRWGGNEAYAGERSMAYKIRDKNVSSRCSVGNKSHFLHIGDCE